MKNKKLTLIVLALIKVFLITLLIIAVTTKQKYEFYTILRWAVMLGSIYFIIVYYEVKNTILVVVFVISAILFNPIAKFVLKKPTWQSIDLIFSICIFITLLFDIYIYFKLNTEER